METTSENDVLDAAAATDDVVVEPPPHSSSSTARLKGAAIVFGSSGEQGRAVVEGLVDAGHHPVFAFGRHYQHEMVSPTQYLTDALGATLWNGDIQNPDDVQSALEHTQATAVVLITTTDLPAELGQTSGFSDAAEAEFQVIVTFFRILKEVHQKDQLPRHIIFLARDNVQAVTRQYFQETGQVWMEPLDDGSIVPHFSAKGRGAEFALDFLSNEPDLKLTVLTLPFLFSNFLGFFCPVQDETKTQWTLSACFGDGSNPIDMMGSKDLSIIVPNVFKNPEKYNGQNLRLVGQRITMDQIAGAFEDLYGKPVIYNPLTVEEVAAMPFAAAPAMAQMCQFIGDPRSLAHDLESTRQVLGIHKPQTFEDWLLTHSESSAFQASGLTKDAPDIVSVTIFGALSAEGMSVVKGLISDTRKKYTIRATVGDASSDDAKALEALDNDRITVVQVDLNDKESCRKAVEGVDGVFLVTHFLSENQPFKDLETEERHIHNVIDACEEANSVRHLVFSTLESAELMQHMPHAGHLKDKDANEQFDVRARAAAYARTKKLSVTYVLLPYYSENFLRNMEAKKGEDGKEEVVVDVPEEEQKTKFLCMSIDDLGPAVANIFDSYQVYAGHEIGLVTDFASYADVKEMMETMVLQSEGEKVEPAVADEMKKDDLIHTTNLQPKHTYMKDFGQMFSQLAHSDAVKMRRSVAKTLQLVPSARPLREWIEQNRNNEAFREKLGLR